MTRVTVLGLAALFAASITGFAHAEIGICCFEDGSCVMMEEADCWASGGCDFIEGAD